MSVAAARRQGGQAQRFGGGRRQVDTFIKNKNSTKYHVVNEKDINKSNVATRTKTIYAPGNRPQNEEGGFGGYHGGDVMASIKNKRIRGDEGSFGNSGSRNVVQIRAASDTQTARFATFKDTYSNVSDKSATRTRSFGTVFEQGKKGTWTAQMKDGNLRRGASLDDSGVKKSTRVARSNNTITTSNKILKGKRANKLSIKSQAQLGSSGTGLNI